MRFPGILPAVTTPFDASGGVDAAALQANVRALLDAGVHGIVGTGTMGEAASLSNDERRQVIAAIVAAVDEGVDALMCLPPLGYRGDDDEVVAFYEAVADAGGLPLMAYNNPEASGV